THAGTCRHVKPLLLPQKRRANAACSRKSCNDSPSASCNASSARDNAALTSCSSDSTAERLARKISRQTSGDPAEIRVKSRNPLPANAMRKSESCADATCHMKTDERKCGTWLTEASTASCTCASM